MIQLRAVEYSLLRKHLRGEDEHLICFVHGGIHSAWHISRCICGMIEVTARLGHAIYFIPLQGTQKCEMYGVGWLHSSWGQVQEVMTGCVHTTPVPGH